MINSTKRNKPYTKTGIKRIPCSRCGAPSNHQWQVCSNNNYYLGVCKKCDIELNKIVLEYFGITNREELLQKYIQSLEER